MNTSRRLTATLAAATLLGSGLIATVPAQAAAPQQSPGAALSAKQNKDLKVLTLNLYLGGSLNPAIEAIQTGGDFYGEVKNLYATIGATNFPLRAATIAQTIKKQNPDIITLNELSNWIVVKDEVNAGLKNYDYLKIMNKAMKKVGLNFKVASLVDNAKIPPFAGLPYVNPEVGCEQPPSALEAKCSLAFADRDAVLYNTKSKSLKFAGKKSAAKGNFKEQVKYDLAGVPVSFNRGWASAQFSWKGKPFTMMTSHFEVESQDGQGTPGATGLENWPSKVQVAQGKELLKVAKKAAKKTQGRVILAGDLNSDANNQYSPTYKNLTKWFGDTYLQTGGKQAPEEGATCCHLGTLGSPNPLDSGDPVVPTRIDLVLTRKAKGVKTQVIENKFRDSQPIWQSDHYFYSASVKLK